MHDVQIVIHIEVYFTLCTRDFPNFTIFIYANDRFVGKIVLFKLTTDEIPWGRIVIIAWYYSLHTLIKDQINSDKSIIAPYNVREISQSISHQGRVSGSPSNSAQRSKEHMVEISIFLRYVRRFKQKTYKWKELNSVLISIILLK